jgi:hypothetical protein
VQVGGRWCALETGAAARGFWARVHIDRMPPRPQLVRAIADGCHDAHANRPAYCTPRFRARRVGFFGARTGRGTADEAASDVAPCGSASGWFFFSDFYNTLPLARERDRRGRRVRPGCARGMARGVRCSQGARHAPRSSRPSSAHWQRTRAAPTSLERLVPLVASGRCSCLQRSAGPHAHLAHIRSRHSTEH